MVERDPQLGAVDGATLTPLVQRTLSRGEAELLEWRREPIAYDLYLPGRVLVRFNGTAAVENKVVPWSLVLKLSRPHSGERARDEGGRREALAYRCSLLADVPGGLTAARALRVDEDDEGAVWLWLEDVADHYGRQWPLSQYGRAAYHLGQFNGAYLVSRPLPTFPWLVTSWTERHSELEKIPAGLAELERLLSDVRVLQAFAVPITEPMTRLLSDQPSFVEILARLPRTLCHHDAQRSNLFARHRADGELETVAIDWESVGDGTIGAEIATLVSGTIRRGDFPADQVSNLDQEVFTGYLRGLRDAGWRGDRELVRLGYAAALALRWFMLPATLRVLADPEAPAILGRVLEATRERTVEQFVLLSQFLLDRADEARALARRHRLLR